MGTLQVRTQAYFRRPEPANNDNRAPRAIYILHRIIFCVTKYYIILIDGLICGGYKIENNFNSRVLDDLNRGRRVPTHYSVTCRN